MSKPKIPRRKSGVLSKKEPRTGAIYTFERPSWRLSNLTLDPNSRWSFAGIERNDLVDLINRVKSFETMTWTEIEGSGNHYIDPEQMAKDALDKLAEMRLDDMKDLIFSLRISGKARLWGIRSEGVFEVIWWDPNHEVCPSKKKHT